MAASNSDRPPSTFHVGIDVGGTFTDLVALRRDGSVEVTKVPTTPSDPSIGIMSGLESLAERLESGNLRDFLGRVDVIVHGTTVATNALLTGKGAKVGLVTTRGFRDALEMRRGIRERLYDNKYAPPKPLVPRYLRIGVTERLDHSGEVIEPLDLDDLRVGLATLRKHEVESVAVCFMHSYVDGRHELEACAMIEREWPEVYVCASHALLPERKFYERVSTTSVNAFVGPIFKHYLDELDSRLAGSGFDGPLRIMKSNGGLMTPAVAAREAAHTILSGPAGAVAAATFWSQRGAEPNLIVVDMGGTSFDVTLIEDGTPLITRDGSIARHRLMLPTLDIHTVGAGGGSIAFVDASGLLDVGPASAGSVPGPACYGRGGAEPTVTDADLLLGYIDPEFFLGGLMKLDPDAAARAVEERVAGPLQLSVLEAAAGIHDVINAKMAAAIREVSVQRGHDPRRFVLVTAGGAAAVHVCAIAHDIGIPEIVIPLNPGVFSAFGMLTTDFKHDFVRTFPGRLHEVEPRGLRRAFDEMKAQAEVVLAGEGVAPEDRAHLMKLDLRYEGQLHEVELAVAEADLDSPSLLAVHRKFHLRHALIYTYATEDDVVEVVNLRLTSTGGTRKIERSGGSSGEDDVAREKGRRRIYLGSRREETEVPVFDQADLAGRARVEGPAVVELIDTTVVIDDHYDLLRDVDGNLRLRAKTHEAVDGGSRQLKENDGRVSP